MSVRRRMRDVIGARVVARSAALADRVDRARAARDGERAEIAHALERVRSAVEALSMREQEAGIAGELLEIRMSLDGLDARLRDVQAMAARAYEAALDWPAALAEIRAAPGYEAPWSVEQPLVTVRIATYNNAEGLCERALASVLAQTYGHWEAVVVGDAVTDDTEARIAALGDPRIRFINLPFRGPYPEERRARWLIAGTAPANRALLEAHGEWIAPLDHDDAFAPDHIEELLARARATRSEVVYGRLKLLDATDGLLLGSIGEWPPRLGEFAWQGALYHAGLTRFLYDERARFADEPGDWNLGRRMWDVGVRFAFLDRFVGDYHYAPWDDDGRAHLAHLRARAPQSDT